MYTHLSNAGSRLLDTMDLYGQKRRREKKNPNNDYSPTAICNKSQPSCVLIRISINMRINKFLHKELHDGILQSCWKPNSTYDDEESLSHLSSNFSLLCGSNDCSVCGSVVLCFVLVGDEMELSFDSACSTEV